MTVLTLNLATFLWYVFVAVSEVFILMGILGALGSGRC